MAAYWIWWLAAAALIAVELLTGTFYLLVVGLAVACGALTALLGGPDWLQWLIAGVLGLVGTGWLQRWKRRFAVKTPQQPPLDIGARVQVVSWGPDRTARVAYRGSTWDAELAASDTPKVETMYITALRGSVLILADQRPVTA
jgi:membrane protein implicated in regulation of membrane protease activity